MTILITGVCGFAGSSLARALAIQGAGHRLIGCDNFSRPGSETNRLELRQQGVEVFHADLRCAADLAALPSADWVIDAAASPSVLGGLDGQMSSRQLVDHNLGGTLNLLEYCKARRAGLIFLSTSRVYSIAPLAALPVVAVDGAFRPDPLAPRLHGMTEAGLDEFFPTAAPISLYGATKLASEALALEYGEVFGFPVFVNRCGVLAGAGQFGRADQGIFAFWINSWRARRPLRYLGFGGQGHQVRDCLHPRDLAPLLQRQMAASAMPVADRVVNVSGGAGSARSLRQLSAWCEGRFGPHQVLADGSPRPFDLPWVVLDAGKAAARWGWRAVTPPDQIWEEIALHADSNPGWLDLSV